MKNLISKSAFAVLITVIAFSFGLAKDPAYNLSIQNLTKPSPNTYEFDIYLLHTNPGESEFGYALGQYFMDFNADIANGGNLTFSIIGSDLPQGSMPTNASIDKNILRMAVNQIPSMDNLPAISPKSPGTMIVKARLQTSAKSFADVPLNLKLRTGPENPYSKVSTMNDGKIIDITVVGTSAANEEAFSGGKESGSVIPKEYALLQNYPNPFNPETSIKFDIPDLSNVKLSVYDITGREVSVLVNEKLEPGSYSYKWNGAQFASGIYFFRVQAGSFIQTRKMALIK